MVQLMVLAAGLGERLRPLTNECPKALIPLGDKPLLAHLLQVAAARGNFKAPSLLNAFWRATELHAFAAHSSHPLRVIEEPELLGTAGGVANVLPQVEADLCIWNSDIWIESAASVLAALGEAPEPCLLVAPATPGSCGSVGVAENGDIVRLRGETFGQEAWGADYVGLMGVPAKSLRHLPARGCLVGDFLLPLLRQGKRVLTQVHDGPWRDLGTLDAYVDSNMKWLSSQGQQNYVAESAVVASSIQLSQCIVGAGARVSGAGVLNRCIIWPNTRLALPSAGLAVSLESAVITPQADAGAQVVTLPVPGRR